MSRTDSRPKTKPVELAAPAKEAVDVRILLNDPEKGSSGLKEWGGFISEAYNSALYWPGCSDLFKRLRTSCPEIVMKNMCYTAWGRHVDPVVNLPDKPSDDDKRYQDFILSDFDNMEGGFGRYMEQAVRTTDDGFTWFTASPALRKRGWVPPDFVTPNSKETEPDEWRSEADDGLIGIRRLAYRDSDTLYRWDMSPQKRLRGFVQQDFPNPEVTLPLSQSLHHQFGDPTNPEGNSPLQAVWRLERIKYGLEVIYGIGSEHAAGYLSVQKTNEGTLTNDDKANVKAAARAVLSAQEGNYALWPYGMNGEVKDITFSAGPAILEAIKHYSILMLSVYMMQFVALNTMTNTGAQASQVDSTNTGILTFNSWLDGMAKQYDDQIGKRLYNWNRERFPGLTARPKITFSHIKNNLAMQELGGFLTSLNGILPLGPDDIKAIRRESGWLPENGPKPGDEIKLTNQLSPQAEQAPQVNPDGTPMPTPPAQLAQRTYNALRSELRVWKRGEAVEL